MLLTDYYPLLISLLLVIGTIGAYQLFAKIQAKLNAIWLNPMLLAIMLIAAFIISIDMPFIQYYESTRVLHGLLEPAVVALGYPLYQHLNSIKHQWKIIALLLTLGVFLVIPISLILTMIMISLPEVAVSLSLKSVTTPIGISLTEALNGNNAITAFAIILAGLFGALFGIPWLKFINVTSPKAQGLAIGAASHALGTATISKISYEHAAYGSLSIILSAVTTAVISPILIPFLFIYLM